jgi:hypothetical protein
VVEIEASPEGTGVLDLLEEDAAVQTSAGPILDRTEANLSSSDVAIAQTRRLLLDASAAHQAGGLPPGARSPDGVKVPQPFSWPFVHMEAL